MIRNAVKKPIDIAMDIIYVPIMGLLMYTIYAV